MAAAQDNEVRLLDLADDLGLDRSSVSRLVTRLEGAKCVRRESCGDDRRGVYTVLSDEGRALYQAAHVVYERTLTDALSAVDLPDGVLASLKNAHS